MKWSLAMDVPTEPRATSWKPHGTTDFTVKGLKGDPLLDKD